MAQSPMIRDYSVFQESRNRIHTEGTNNMSQALYIRSQEARLLELRATLADPLRPKSVKEEALHDIRQIERELGIEGSDYNKKSNT